MGVRGGFTVLLLLLGLTWTLAIPLPEDKILDNVDKRTLDDGLGFPMPGYNPYLTPYGLYPGLKPLRPVIPPGLLINRFATVAPPVDPVATFFKTKKDEFLNKLFNQIIMPTEPTDIEVRSVTDPGEEDPVTDTISTTVAPKIDPSVFISKKFDFLAQLFKALNTTTPAPDPSITTDPTATTIKPTIVPPGFWVPFPKPPKPPKPSKPPKPAKVKATAVYSIDPVVLQSILSALDTSSDSEPKLATRKASFLDELLHRVTEPPPTASIESRSIFPAGYWIPPYIYAAKMGIYLDKIFDTLDTAAASETDPSKRDTTSDKDPSSLILAELTALKNEMAKAYAEGIKAAKTGAGTKAPPKSLKKPVWGPKTTPAPDPAEQKIALLSDLFDKLAEIQQQMVGGPTGLNLTSNLSTISTTTPSYWAPDPAAPDIGEYYKTKTQDFLTQLFAEKSAGTAVADE